MLKDVRTYDIIFIGVDVLGTFISYLFYTCYAFVLLMCLVVGTWNVLLNDYVWAAVLYAFTILNGYLLYKSIKMYRRRKELESRKVQAEKTLEIIERNKNKK